MRRGCRKENASGQLGSTDGCLSVSPRLHFSIRRTDAMTKRQQIIPTPNSLEFRDEIAYFKLAR
jgi:hypothetical protein